jgi:hypothetical protein
MKREDDAAAAIDIVNNTTTTNVLSSVGMHLALELAQTCGVEHIMGMDVMIGVELRMITN